MKIAVLGRGKSLNRYKPTGYDKLYLVNDMTEEIKILGINMFDAEEIIHVCGRKGATVMCGDTYHNLGVNRIVVNAISLNHICNIKRHQQSHDRKIEARPEMMNTRGYPPYGWKAILKEKTKALKSDNGNCWPTTGLFAIDLALMENSPKEIHLFGFDLYQRNYLIKKNRPHQTKSNPKVKAMKMCLEKLVREFKETKFYNYSEINIEAENWNTQKNG